MYYHITFASGWSVIKEKNSPIQALAKIRYTPKAAESTFFMQPVYEYSPRCGAAQDYKNFVTAYLQAQKGGK